ncbi:MAG: cytochrome c3 family protein [Bacteroidota bacterium]
MSVKSFVILIGCVGLLLLIIVVGPLRLPIVTAMDRGEDQTQTIKFSHQYHLKDVGASCIDCHSTAQKSKGARDNILPKMADCYKCHDEKTTECKYCHLGAEPYVPFSTPERSIMFSHEYHLDTLELVCENCHKGLDSVAYSGPSSLPTMAICYKCHNGGLESLESQEIIKADNDSLEFKIRLATNICEACHLSTVGLLLPSHRVSDFKKEHKQFARLGGRDENCQMCHRTDTFCQDCHTDAVIGKTDAKKSDVYTSFGAPTSRSGTDRGKPMTLELVHSLNYRFTHGIEAKGKASDCSSCHEVRTFCVQCHAQDGGITLRNQPAPVWHSGVGFTTGRMAGSGGGRHAEFARRDIETCQACHDTQGSDPICITCHNDPDGVRGTDPKTHQGGYLNSEHGNWHNDPGAICYICHTDPNAHPGGVKGRFFCGYCHG